MSSSVENRPAQQRRGNSRRRRGGSSVEGNRRSRSGSSNKGNLDPRRRMEESKARRKEIQAPPTIWQRLMSFFTGKPVAGTAKKTAPSSKTSTKSKRPSSSGKQDAKTTRSAPSAPAQDLGQRIADVSCGKLYVGNLSYDSTEEHLNELFSGIGKVDSAEVVSHRRTQRSKGYAFVHMNSIDEAKRAVEILHDKDFMGRKLIVSGARSGREQEDEDGNEAAPATESPESQES